MTKRPTSSSFPPEKIKTSRKNRPTFKKVNLYASKQQQTHGIKPQKPSDQPSIDPSRSTMNTLLAFLPLIALAMSNPCLPCNCGLGPGKDVCQHDSCTPLVVRPVDVPKPSPPKPKVVYTSVGLPSLGPIKGPCTCHTSLVKPATVPRPHCGVCGGGSIDISNDQHLSLSQKQRIMYGGGLAAPSYAPAYSATPVLVDEMAQGQGNPANYVPADPVSLSLAYKIAQEAREHNEDKLAFGFRTLPKDMPLYITKPGLNIPEENLFNLNGQIVELKKIAAGSSKSVDEEAADQLAQLAEEEEEANLDAGASFKHVSLGEIGYGPAKIKDPLFVSVQSSGLGALDDGLSQAVKDCNDGFKPGNVIISQVPKNEPIELPKPLPEPCGSDEVSFFARPPPPALLPRPLTYFSSSAASSASSSNMFSKNVFLQKMGCN